MISTIIQWLAIIAILGAYLYITQRKKLPALAPAQKALGGKAGAAGSLFDDSATASGAEKKKKAKKQQQKKPVPQQAAPVAAAPRVVVADEIEVPDIKELREDKDSLARLAGFKAGALAKSGKGSQQQTQQDSSSAASSSKKEKKQQQQQAQQAGKPAGLPTTAAVAPISPALGATSSTSSTTGADGDIDSVDSVDEENVIDDMLEKTVAPGVLRITPGQEDFTTVTRKKGSQEKKDTGLTALQKKNQKKNELKKEMKKLDREDQLQRLEAHKKEQRLAREAEERKKPQKAAAPAPATSSWTAGAPTNKSATSAGGLLDVFDSSSSNTNKSRKGAVTTPSSSDIDSTQYAELGLSDEQRKDIPAEVLAEYLAERRENAPQEQEWVEVKRPRRVERKKGPAESETDSDINQGGFASQIPPITTNPLSSKGGQPKKAPRQYSAQELEIPAMPAMPPASNGWDAHAW